jgi:hypothetical protein
MDPLHLQDNLNHMYVARNLLNAKFFPDCEGTQIIWGKVELDVHAKMDPAHVNCSVSP